MKNLYVIIGVIFIFLSCAGRRVTAVGGDKDVYRCISSARR
ncbi:MAG: hypothetical protein RR770_05670 [Bacteroidales bacterium]